MSLKAKPQHTELDHIRDTLTGMVDVVGETRHDVKQLDSKVDKRFDQQDKEIAELKADNVEIKEMLKALLSR